MDLIFFGSSSVPKFLSNPEVIIRLPADIFTGPIGKYGSENWIPRFGNAVGGLSSSSRRDGL